MPERLIVLAAGELADLHKRYRVTSALPPHLAVLDLDEAELDAVRRRAGVRTVISDAQAPIPDSLNQTEQLFIRAWQQRRGMHDKQRPGEGNAWDAQGRSAPDLPD